MDPTAKTIPIGDAHTAIVDSKNFDYLNIFTWRIHKNYRSFYAITSSRYAGKTRNISMHRLINKTPRGMVCHHRNRNTLDNREANLLNMTPAEHKLTHLNNSLSIKFEPQTGKRTEPTPKIG